MGRRTDLPIILSHDTHTGLLVLHNSGRFELHVLRLNKDIQGGHGFEAEDIAGVKAVLQFEDREAFEITTRLMMQALDLWKDKRKEMTDED